MPTDHTRVQAVFVAAAEITDPVARVLFVAESCDGDLALKARVEALLRAHDQTDTLLDAPLVASPDSDHAGTVAFTPDREHAETRTSGGGADTSDDEIPLGFLTPSKRPDSLGRIGHYEVLQVLGKGGFGIVFRAFDDVLQRIVAIKVMAPQLAATSPARKRFLREAQSSAKVRHENVVQVYEVGEQPLPYLVMEFIPGETLQQRLTRTGPLNVPEVLRIGRQIAEGLAAAHATDLIHRDIKPGNILLEGGHHKVKITDFGLARAADDASISQSGIIAGTPMYMAPEQALGQKLDQRADLFSLGSVLYQMAAGRPPFRANSTVAVLKRVADDTPRPIREIIPEVPQWLCGIIAKLHAKNPDERFQSAREVADLLVDCEAKLKAKQEVKYVIPGEPSRVSGRVERPSASAGRVKWVAAAVLLLPVLALAVTEFTGVTHLFRQQVTPVTGPVLVAKNELPPLADGWVRLFNGKDLTGWKINPDQGGQWEVKDGILKGSSRRTYLFSERGDYVNFHLLAEAKINLGGLSGICFRTPFARRSGKPSWQVGPDGGYDAELQKSLTHPNPTGSVLELVVGPRPIVLGRVADDSLTRPDEWFTLEIIAEENRFITKVNGKETANCSDPLNKYPTGHIAFEVWNPDTVVQFRKIEIKELPSAPVAQPEPLPPTFKNSLGMEFAVVPKGKSWLGGGKDKLGDKEVEIPADFYLGKYEVTQEEWTQVMGENPSHFSRTGDGKDAVKDIPDADLKRFPVENVSWDQCQIFLAKLNQQAKERGWVYRLPTEVEWEYACRGGPMADKANSAFDFYFARPTNTLLPEQANFSETELKRTCMVGSYPPNALGLYDLYGNVWEWCDDKHKTNTEVSARKILGACYLVGSVGCRTVNCAKDATSLRYSGLGLRLARVPSGAPSPAAKTPVADPDRTAAESVLALGGIVRVDGDIREIKAAADLPKGAFRLTHVVLGDKAVAASALVAFKDCKHLTHLHLSGESVTDEGLANFKGCANLTFLNLHDNELVTNAGLAHLKDCKKLRSLDLSNASNVGDDGLAHFKDCTDLASLALYGTKATDAGLAHFEDCKNLRAADLNGLPITDAGLAHLAGLTALVHLDLTKTKVTEKGVGELKKALPQCKIAWDGGVFEPR